MTTVGALTYISEKIPMFSNVFEMAITIPIAVIALALHPYICFAAVAISAVSICVICMYIFFLIFFFLKKRNTPSQDGLQAKKTFSLYFHIRPLFFFS